MTVTSITPEIPRDRWSRPLVVPPNGGKGVPYTRCTTFVKVIEDTYNLGRWMNRMTALGLSERPDLLLAVGAHRDDKTKLNKICEDAQEAAKAHAAATTGTALHALTERIDRGQDVGVVPDAYLADLRAYEEATKDLTATHIEQFCVLDNLQIGGTPDRVVKYQGKRYIADVKTGTIEYGALAIAMQLAVYARSNTYDHTTGQRGLHDADLQRGIVIHLPAGTGTCELKWVDLEQGWNAVRVARDVREKRKLKYGDLMSPFNAALEVPTEPAPEPPVDLAALIAQCPTDDAVRRLWAAHADKWDDTLTEAARAHIAALQAAS